MARPGIARKFLPKTALRLPSHAGSAKHPRKRDGNVTVMFVDIEGCTRLCEDLRPMEMNRVIETYFSRYLDIVRGAGGEVTEVLGDGLVALFEGPSVREDTARAILAALRIRESTHELNARARRRHDPIVVNIGLNAGRASVGITRLRGQSGERWFYAATGPVTNIAARLCGLARQGQIFVTGTMAKRVSGTYRVRSLGPQSLKNVSNPVEVFEILPTKVKQESRSGMRRRRGTNG